MFTRWHLCLIVCWRGSDRSSTMVVGSRSDGHVFRIPIDLLSFSHIALSTRLMLMECQTGKLSIAYQFLSLSCINGLSILKLTQFLSIGLPLQPLRCFHSVVFSTKNHNFYCCLLLDAQTRKRTTRGIAKPHRKSDYYVTMRSNIKQDE